MFQSHAGSIEARLRLLHPGFQHAGFNPTLVRLRLVPALSSFACRRSFNPTLVRLRPRPDRPYLARGRAFQSHAGSIEAISNLSGQKP